MSIENLAYVKISIINNKPNLTIFFVHAMGEYIIWNKIMVHFKNNKNAFELYNKKHFYNLPVF